MKFHMALALIYFIAFVMVFVHLWGTPELFEDEHITILLFAFIPIMAASVGVYCKWKGVW